MDELAARMKKARLDRGMTQGQLADKLRIRQSMVSMIEDGEELEDGEIYGVDLGKRIAAFIESGAGPTTKTPRGPYKSRITLPRSR